LEPTDSCLCANPSFQFGVRDCANSACGATAPQVIAFASSLCASMWKRIPSRTAKGLLTLSLRSRHSGNGHTSAGCGYHTGQFQFKLTFSSTTTTTTSSSSSASSTVDNERRALDDGGYEFGGVEYRPSVFVCGFKWRSCLHYIHHKRWYFLARKGRISR
jgi:hypothetical protein